MAPTGIDYLHLIAEDHQKRLRDEAGRIDYATLTNPSPSSGNSRKVDRKTVP